MTDEEEVWALSRPDTPDPTAELEQWCREMESRLDNMHAVTNEHWDRMEGGDEAHRDLMGRVARLEAYATNVKAHRDLEARVARCEARLDGRGHEVARDLTPAEAMDEIADMIRAEKPPHPSDWSQYNEWLAAQADPAPASPRDSDLMDMDPDTPGRWTPASPEDTEGLEVWPRLIDLSRDHPILQRDFGAAGLLYNILDAAHRKDTQRLTARLEEAERERGEKDAEIARLKQGQKSDRVPPGPPDMPPACKYCKGHYISGGSMMAVAHEEGCPTQDIARLKRDNYALRLRLEGIVVTEEDGAGMIRQERQRQMSEEGWTREHDDEHVQGELAKVAAILAVAHTNASVQPGVTDPDKSSLEDPWGLLSKHRHDRVRTLTIAGALIAAEIDRVVRRQSQEINRALHAQEADDE